MALKEDSAHVEKTLAQSISSVDRDGQRANETVLQDWDDKEEKSLV
jgi:hypothetical protein